MKKWVIRPLLHPLRTHLLQNGVRFILIRAEVGERDTFLCLMAARHEVAKFRFLGAFKKFKLACPLTEAACDNLIAAILTGTHQRGLIELGRFHKSLHLCIVPDAKGMIFEWTQVRQV